MRIGSYRKTANQEKEWGDPPEARGLAPDRRSIGMSTGVSSGGDAGAAAGAGVPGTQRAVDGNRAGGGAVVKQHTYMKNKCIC